MNNKLLAMLIAMSILLLQYSIIVNAEEESENCSIVYLVSYSNNHVEDSNVGIKVKTVDNVDALEIIESTFVTVNFGDLKENTKMLDYVSELIKSGKVFFIKADGYAANVTLIKELLGYDLGKEALAIETSQGALEERINTFGFMVFIDSRSQLQVVRQQADYVTLNSHSLDDEQKRELLLSSQKPDLHEQIDAVFEFLSYNSPSDVTSYSDQDIPLTIQSFDVGANYENIYDTAHYYEGSNRVGSITRRILAARLHPVTSVKVGTPSPVATGNTKWAFQAVVNMSPRWNQYKTKNYECYVSFTTYPVSSSSSTYKIIIMDYQPKIDTSGVTDVTYSIGANASMGEKGANSGITGGVTWKKSYKDITFTCRYEAGPSTPTNIARWRFNMSGWNRLFPKEVEKNTIELIAAVRVDNQGNTRAGVQLNTQPKWSRIGGTFTWQDYLLEAPMSKVTFRLPVR